MSLKSFFSVLVIKISLFELFDFLASVWYLHPPTHSAKTSLYLPSDFTLHGGSAKHCHNNLPKYIPCLSNMLFIFQGGFVPNVFKVLAHRPEEFRAFFAYYNTLMNTETGGLSKADRELIVVATSAHNHCLYCVVAHSALHRIYSKKPMLADQVVVNYQVAELSARERAMLDFALAVCRSETLTDKHFSSLEAHGFDREDIWDIAAIAAFFAMSNRLAHLTDMRPNTEFYNMGRVPRDKRPKPDEKDSGS
uniref:Si:ch211-175m2.5 n=1 Tax=Astyanax mexicanus TaxID=7994 RepID=A0A3B1J183_ASTMX